MPIWQLCDTSSISRSAALLPCRPKRDRAAPVHVIMSSAYDPGMPSEKGMISTDQPDPTLTCLQSILEEQLSLCFVLIDENVPVDPARIRTVLCPLFIANQSWRLRSLSALPLGLGPIGQLRRSSKSSIEAVNRVY